MDDTATPSTSKTYSCLKLPHTTLHHRILSSTALALNFCSTLSEAAPIPAIWSKYDRDDARLANRNNNNLEKIPPQRANYFYGQQPLVHTFETESSCSRKCTLPCVVQNVEDLMMPRWICPSHPVEHSMSTSDAKNIDLLPFNSQFLLIIVPLVIITLILLVIFWVRRSSTSVSSAMDE